MMLVYLTCLLTASSVYGATLNETQTLINTVFTGYDKRVRPVKDQDDVVNVTAEVNLMGIPEFDEGAEKLKTTMFLIFTWTDEYLTWNPLTNNNIYYIKVPETEIWTPDVVHGNSYNKIKQIGDQKRLVTIQFNGEITWVPGDIFESGCSLDVTYYPYDTQTCRVMTFPWSYWNFEVALYPKNTSVNMNVFDENGSWKVTSATVFSNNIELKITEYTLGYSVLFTQLVLQRRSSFYIGTAVLPPAVLVALSIFTFLLPPQCGEKVSYCVTMFLSVAVFLTFIADGMPHTSSSISIFIAYLSTTLVIVSIGLICSILIVRLYMNEDDKNIPACIKRLMSPNSKVTPIVNKEKVQDDDKPAKLTWQRLALKIDMYTFLAFLSITLLFNIAIFSVLSLNSK